MEQGAQFKTIVAVPTPFRNSLQICRSALRDHLLLLHSAGVGSIVSNGTTAEFASLTMAERKAALECCRKHFPGQVVNNISATCVSDSLELLEHSRDFADAVVLLPPYYFAPVSSAGLKEFFTAVLARSRIPSYLYNFPKYTQVRISPRLVTDLTKQISSLSGVKDSDADIDSTILIKESNPHLEVLSGCDESLVEVYGAHLDGIVTGGYNAFPELLYSVRSAIVSGDAEKATLLTRLFLQWKHFVTQNSSHLIPAIKLSIVTRIPGYPHRVRPPLVAADQRLETSVAQLVKSVVAEHDSMAASSSPSCSAIFPSQKMSY